VKKGMKHLAVRHVSLALLLSVMVAGSGFAQEFKLNELGTSADLILIGSFRALSVDGLTVTVEITAVRVLQGDQFVTPQAPVLVKCKIGQSHADTI
jgi:hypothetical protein